MTIATPAQFNAKAFLQQVSQVPGVYCMYDSQQQILYVGKAKRLKARLSSYFRQQGLNAKTEALVEKIADIEITITHSETEALLLEQTLIKNLHPPYNILLRDDKSYPYIFVSNRHPFPALEFRRVRRKSQPGRYFGPFPSSYAVRESLSLMQKIFRIRNCEDSVFAHRSRPCLQYQIERCTAPCVGFIQQDEYQRHLEHALQCLEGRSNQVSKQLEQEMEQAAAALNFEQAALFRDQIQKLRQLQVEQAVDIQAGDADVFAYVQQNATDVVSLLIIRQGQMIGSQIFKPNNELDFAGEQILTEIISQYYIANERRAPREIIISLDLPEKQLLEEALSQLSHHKVRLAHQVRSHRAQWLRLAITNAEQYLITRIANQQHILQRFRALQVLLKLEKLPQRIECFDISHSHGEATVASCVVFNQQGPLKSDYRHFNINNITPGDDYAAMRQALQRRYRHVAENPEKKPDLLIMDGGKGQLNLAKEILQEIPAMANVDILGVAKGSTRKPGLETLFLNHAQQTITVDSTSPALHLIQQIRDEAHRFAITSHRSRRDKARRISTLEEIPQIGPKRRRELLRYFGGLPGVKNASRTDLAKVPGISQALADEIYLALHDKN